MNGDEKWSGEQKTQRVREGENVPELEAMTAIVHSGSRGTAAVNRAPWHL